MKNILIPILAMTFAACNSSNPKQETTTAETETQKVEINSDRLVLSIENQVEEIEAKSDRLLVKKEITTAELRPQIAQKWSKIHAYMDNGTVLRIKTYPHDAVSKRTEEFYFSNNDLMYVAIEDDGSGKEEKVDKGYFFHNSEVIFEDNKSEESETAIRESDAERLLQEAKEYLELIK